MGNTDRVIFSLGLALATAIRATEAFRPENERIYDAQFDYSILPIFWRGLLLPGIRQLLILLLEKFAMGTPGMLFCRTRFIDDALVDSLERGCEQVVCLGAGYDTRAYRIPGIERTHFYELDLPVPQSLKREHMGKVLGDLPTNIIFVPIDFDQQSIEDELTAAGYQTGVQTFFIWEGVTQYITAEAVDATLRFASRSAPGSLVAFTYIHNGIIEGSTRSQIDERIMERIERRGMPWIFGLDPHELDEWLAKRGFRLVDQANAAEYRARYITPVGRQMNIYEGERMALAELSGEKIRDQ